MGCEEEFIPGGYIGEHSKAEKTRFWVCVPVPPFCHPVLPHPTFADGFPHRSGFENHLLVREIAATFQFTPDEVGAYFSLVNQDAKRTRRRFEKARKLLDTMSDVE